MVNETEPWSNQSGCLSNRKFPSLAVSEKLVPPKIGIWPSSWMFPLTGMPIFSASSLTDSGTAAAAMNLRPLVTSRCSKSEHSERVAASAHPKRDL